MKTHVTALISVFVAAAFLLPQTASASLIYDSSLQASAQGFGTAPRDLTLQANGTESGGVGVDSSGNIVFGSVIQDSVAHPNVFMGNHVENSASLDDLPMPRQDDQKYGVPTTSSLGITTASQIGVLFNATEPAGNSINVLDITLKFFKSDGTFLGAIDGQNNFASSDPGNGVAGFTFVVAADQQAFVNSLLAQGGGGTHLALEATISNAAGGPESFLIYNLLPGGPGEGTPAPEPASIALLGLGLLGFAASRRKPVK